MCPANIEQKNYLHMLSTIHFPRKSYGFRDIKKRAMFLAVSSRNSGKKFLQNFVLEKYAQIFSTVMSVCLSVCQSRTIRP
jgi:hypothetical protein